MHFADKDYEYLSGASDEYGNEIVIFLCEWQLGMVWISHNKQEQSENEDGTYCHGYYLSSATYKLSYNEAILFKNKVMEEKKL